MTAAPPPPDILCIGSALWDIIARAQHAMRSGGDVPGRIGRQPGGVALNVAVALARQGMRPAVLSAIGADEPGQSLRSAAAARGVDCTWITVTADPTDTYLAIEDPRGEVFGAVADCASLERAGAEILAPLRDGRLASAKTPWTGAVVIDGNLPTDLLSALPAEPGLRGARLAFIPASPGKADRLRRIVAEHGGTVYVNRQEAEILCLAQFDRARDAAVALARAGAACAVVTNGKRRAAVATGGTLLTAKPPKVAARTTTGAGDVFMAAHLAATVRGLGPQAALDCAIEAAAVHISAEPAS